MSDMGWWIIHADEIIEMLRAVANGDSPDIVFAELWANGQINETILEGDENAA